MKILSIDHIGIAVADLEKGLALYRDIMGMEYLGEDYVEEQKVRVGILRVGGIKIELLEPTSQDSAIARFLAKGGRGVHHIAYLVDCLDEALTQCVEQGLKPIDQQPRIGAYGRKMAFLQLKSTAGVLTELICDNDNSQGA